MHIVYVHIYIYIERASARVPPTPHSGGLGRRWSVRCIWLMMVMMMKMTRMMSVMIMVMKRRMMIMMIMCKNQFYVRTAVSAKGRGSMPTRARCVKLLCGHHARAGRLKASMTRLLGNHARRGNGTCHKKRTKRNGDSNGPSWPIAGICCIEGAVGLAAAARNAC